MPEYKFIYIKKIIARDLNEALKLSKNKEPEFESINLNEGCQLEPCIGFSAEQQDIEE